MKKTIFLMFATAMLAALLISSLQEWAEHMISRDNSDDIIFLFWIAAIGYGWLLTAFQILKDKIS